MNHPLSYKDAGVDIDAGDALVERIKPLAKKTMREGVLAGIGGFGALFEVPKRYKEPVLVSGTDGVGTKLKLAFEYLPMFLKQGIKEWNKGSIYLANGSRVLADSTSGSSVRGFSFNLIFLDEFAFVPNNIAEEFFNSTYPTISSGKTSKVVIVSTPNGMNLFYKMWMKAVEKTSTYVPIEIHWSMVPGRDQAWAEETIRNTSQRQFDQEFGCEFLGSSNTLINGSKLASLHWKEPVARMECMDVF